MLRPQREAVKAGTSLTLRTKTNLLTDQIPSLLNAKAFAGLVGSAPLRTTTLASVLFIAIRGKLRNVIYVKAPERMGY